MTTWAQRKRHEFIHAKAACGEPFNRSDLVEAFTITPQTATATLHQFEALYPDIIAFDQSIKAFVPAARVAHNPSKPSQRWLYRARSLLEAVRDNDPNDIVADGGVTAAMVWAQDAADLLADTPFGRHDDIQP